jgi:peptidoglycan/xylan/chitin deacetylase (PgdA/CDA1 family)
MRAAILLAVGCAGPGLAVPPDPGEPVTGTTIVSLTFDDSLADQAQLGDMLAARGLRATFYTNSGRFGADGHLTLEQVRDLASGGHEIAGHTIDHADLPTLPAALQMHEICDDRAALLGLGFTVTSFAYPYGDSSAATEQIVAGCGYSSARGVGSLVELTSCQHCATANPIPPIDPFNLKTHSSIKIDTTLETIEGYVTEAEGRGGWVPLVFHHVCDGCDPLSIAPATMEAFLDWLAARRDAGTIVETVGDVMAGSAAAQRGE